MESVHPNYIIGPSCADQGTGQGWDVKGNDAYTKLLLHCDGTDESTTIPDSSASAHGNATVNGDAQLDTAYKKFGSASLLLDGTGDYISFADSDDWNPAAGAFTLEARVRVLSTSGTQQILGQYAANNDYWYLRISSGGVGFRHYSAPLYLTMTSSLSAIQQNTSYHIAVIRGWGGGASSWALTINGVAVDTETAAGAFQDIGSALEIGGRAGFDFLGGWLEEIRISKGIARWTSNFIPPYGPYS